MRATHVGIAKSCSLFLLHVPRICGIVHNETRMKTHLQSSLARPFVSGSKAKAASPPPTPNHSFKRTVNGLRPSPAA
jgi:hypothetical protein